MSSNVVETIVGAAVLCVAGGFMYYAAATSDLRAGGSYDLSAKFFKADGITPGGDVRLSGVKIGSVRTVDLDPETFEAKLVFSVREGIAIPSDSSAKIASEGLLGGAHLAIEPGGSEYSLEPGEDIEYTQGSVSLIDLIGKAIHSSVGGE